MLEVRAGQLWLYEERCGWHEITSVVMPLCDLGHHGWWLCASTKISVDGGMPSGGLRSRRRKHQLIRAGRGGRRWKLLSHE